MNRVLSSLAAALVLVANLAAAPVPNHPQDKAKTLPKAIKPTKAAGKTKASQVEKKPYQVGIASWYGKQFHGITTASGEDFDIFKLTSAHRQLPLRTCVKFTNLKNGKSILAPAN